MQLMLCGINNHLKKWKSIILVYQNMKKCEYNGFEANNFAPSVMPYK